jgi:hypothetical protein
MTDKKFRVEVQTGKDRIESFDIEATNLQEAWIKGIRVSKCPVVLNIREVV